MQDKNYFNKVCNSTTEEVLKFIFVTPPNNQNNQNHFMDIHLHRHLIVTDSLLCPWEKKALTFF